MGLWKASIVYNVWVYVYPFLLSIMSHDKGESVTELVKLSEQQLCS